MVTFIAIEALIVYNIKTEDHDEIKQNGNAVNVFRHYSNNTNVHILQQW